MYSLQHVFWRGAMALSLLVVGGVGAGVSHAPGASAQACRASQPAAGPVSAAHAATWRELALLQRRQMTDRPVRDGA